MELFFIGFMDLSAVFVDVELAAVSVRTNAAVSVRTNLTKPSRYSARDYIECTTSQSTHFVR